MSNYDLMIKRKKAASKVAANLQRKNCKAEKYLTHNESNGFHLLQNTGSDLSVALQSSEWLSECAEKVEAPSPK